MRWEVFKQDAAGKPHQAVGSVHAADAEGALLNARHVFARRPAAVSLWVTPAAAIHSWTAEELAGPTGGMTAVDASQGHGQAGEVRPSRRADQQAEQEAERTYLVFVKTTERRSMTFVDHVGEVSAGGPAAALAAARQQHAGERVLAWWLVPKSEVSASDPDDVESWFEPARDKTYKQQSAYGRVRPGGARSRV